MDNEKIKELATKLAKRLYNDDKAYNSILWWGNEPKERKAEELELTLKFLLEAHCIVEKKVIQDDYADVKNAVADWESSELTERDNYFEYGRVFGNKEVLESYFSKDDLIGKDTEK